MPRNTKYYADQNLTREHYKKCKRIDATLKFFGIAALLYVFLNAFINNFPK